MQPIADCILCYDSTNYFNKRFEWKILYSMPAVIRQHFLSQNVFVHSGFRKQEQNFLTIFRAGLQRKFCCLILSANRATLSLHSASFCSEQLCAARSLVTFFLRTTSGPGLG